MVSVVCDMVPLACRSRPLRILCIEEDPLQRKLLAACLEAIKAEALFAPRAANAVWLFRRHPVDVVLMDLDWHAAEEIAAFQEMRQVPRWGRRVPIVAVTDNDSGWSERAYREAGFAALCEKPIQPMQLFAIVDDVLRDGHQAPLLERPSPSQLLPHSA
jgi:CheY-like chemotaxis protein